MASIWDLPRREDQRGSAMVEPRARMLQVLGLLGTPFPTSSELRTGVMYRGGKMDAMAGGPTRSEFEDEQIRKVSDLGLNLFGIFKGVKGATKAEKQALLKAQQMAREGADRDTIWNATLWYKGKDGKWRTEIDDSVAQWKTNFPEFKQDELQNIISHDAAYQAYPWLKDVDTVVQRGLHEGSWDDRLQKIKVEAPDRMQAKSVALHEAQHAIQQREGMARGGSPEQFSKGSKHAVEELSAKLQRLENQAGAEADLWLAEYPERVKEAIDYMKAQDLFDPNVSLREQVKFAIFDQDSTYKSLTEEWRKATEKMNKRPMEQYRSLLGEVDARNTQKRMDMTLDQRREFPPWSTWDVPEEQQIVRFGDGPAMSIADTSMDDLAAQLEAMRAANKAKGVPIETGTGDLRNEIARRNAVGLLGLPETNTAADRARAMGVDTPVFRGSPTFNRPEPDVTLGWASTSPEVANTYALKHRLRGGSWEEPESSFAPYVMPLLAKVDETVDAGGAQFHSVPFENMVMSADDVKNRIWPKSVKIANVKDVGGGRKDIVADSVAAYPRNIRSRFAAFDPARRDEADLLAGLLPYAIPAGLLGMFLTRPGEGYE